MWQYTVEDQYKITVKPVLLHYNLNWQSTYPDSKMAEVFLSIYIGYPFKW